STKTPIFWGGVGPRSPKGFWVGGVFNLGRKGDLVRGALLYKQHSLNCMTLVRLKRHGQILMEMMKESGLRVDFIYGESNQSTRQAKLNSLASGEIEVLICSTILEVGVDVPRVGAVLFVGWGRAEVEMGKGGGVG
ncbi:ATP-dependent helicase, partial [Escherichia coli]|nr:ATP-dependent helicase [Escherichia coli]